MRRPAVGLLRLGRARRHGRRRPEAVRWRVRHGMARDHSRDHARVGVRRRRPADHVVGLAVGAGRGPAKAMVVRHHVEDHALVVLHAAVLRGWRRRLLRLLLLRRCTPGLRIAAMLARPSFRAPLALRLPSDLLLGRRDDIEKMAARRMPRPAHPMGRRLMRQRRRLVPLHRGCPRLEKRLPLDLRFRDDKVSR